jgi:hypothetical protein
MCSSETPFDFQISTCWRCFISEEGTPHNHRCENFRSPKKAFNLKSCSLLVAFCIDKRKFVIAYCYDHVGILKITNVNYYKLIFFIGVTVWSGIGVSHTSHPNSLTPFSSLRLYLAVHIFNAEGHCVLDIDMRCETASGLFSRLSMKSVGPTPSTPSSNCYASLFWAFPAFPRSLDCLDVALSTGVSAKGRGITISQYSLATSVWSCWHTPERAVRKCKWPNEGSFKHNHSRNSWAFVLRLQYSNGWFPFILKLKTHRSACSPTCVYCGWSETAYEIWGSHSSEGSYFHLLGNDTV